MKCIRCGKEFNSYIPYRNAESYGEIVYYACEHCGKLYRFERKVEISDAEFCADSYQVDNWGHDVVSDEEYYKTHKRD